MANYNRSAAQPTKSCIDSARLNSQPASTSCEAIWDCWSTSPGTSCTLAGQMQHYESCNNNTKIANLYQQDLLSSWFLPGSHSTNQNQSQDFQDGMGMPVYRDEFSRMNVENASSANQHDGDVAWSDSDASQQLFDTSPPADAQTGCTSLARIGEPAQFLSNPPPMNSAIVGNLQSDENTSRLAVSNSDQKGLLHTNASEFSSRTSSSPPADGVNSYGQIMQHLVIPFNRRPCWPTNLGSISSCTQTSTNNSIVDSARSQIDHSSATCDSDLFRHDLHDKEEAVLEGVYNPNTVVDVCDQIHLYEELHGLLSKTIETPTSGSASCREETPVANGHPSSTMLSTTDGTYPDQLPWTQFAIVSRGAAGAQSGLLDLQQAGQTGLEVQNCAHTQDRLSIETRKLDDSSNPNQELGVSGVHNIDAAISSGQLRRSEAIDSDNTEGVPPRKLLPKPSDSEHCQMESGFRIEDAAKRNSIVRCVWEQNIAQLQLANSSSEHHRNLWQIQSQTLFGKLPSSSLLGSSSNSGNLDVPTAVGPALNTNGRPRARRGSATDPQSVYARHRRERIKGRLKVLQHLVPNGAKVDIVTMLEEAINYVKFLQAQVGFLSSDELWIYAPTIYNGIDVSMGSRQSRSE